MKIETFKPMAAPGVPNKDPFVRVGKGRGCNCGCSPGFWISFSDGKNGTLIRFKTRKEMEAALKVLI